MQRYALHFRVLRVSHMFNKFCIHVEFCSHHHKIQNKDFKKSNTGLASIIQARRKKWRCLYVYLVVCSSMVLSASH